MITPTALIVTVVVALTIVVCVLAVHSKLRLRYQLLAVFAGVAVALGVVAVDRGEAPEPFRAERKLIAFSTVEAVDVGDDGDDARLMLRTIPAGDPVTSDDHIPLVGDRPTNPRLVSIGTKLAVPAELDAGDDVTLHSAPDAEAEDARLPSPVDALLVAVHEADDGATRVVDVIVGAASANRLAQMLGRGDVLMVRPP